MNSLETEDAPAFDPKRWGDGTTIPAGVREAFSDLAGPLGIRMLSGGLLHRTLYLRTEQGEFVLQRVSDVFAPAIHENIEAVTGHLKARGFRTFELLPSVRGDLSVEIPGQGRWRLLTHLEGVCFERIESEAQAHSAGQLVGRFHAALDDFEAPLAPMGIPFRNTPLYLEQLNQALERERDHRDIALVREAAARIEASLDQLGPIPGVPERVIHGDLKLANLLFEGRTPPARDRALALIDFDTLMRAPLYCEWGDAWRSWCNQSGEDRQGATFDLGIFEASLRGFVEGYGKALIPAEVDSLGRATERITLELCARFATDILEESYFAWDPSRFDSAADHNAERLRSQLQFFEATSACYDERREILAVLSKVSRA